MEFKGKYKNWYDRLIKAKYRQEWAEHLVEKFINEWENEEYWKNEKEKLVKSFNGNEEKVNKVMEQQKRRCVPEERVKALEWVRERDLELLKKAIPKAEMEDGVWYDCEDDAKSVARFGGKAKWDKERDMFLAPGQQQFGADGWLDHWEDAIDNGYAGFVPMWKVEE